MINVSIINMKQRADFKKEDITTYSEMIKGIRDSIKKTGLEANIIQTSCNNPAHFKINNGNKNYGDISPIVCGDFLSGVDLDIHDEIIFEPIKKVVEDYKSKFKLIHKIDINTYF